MIKDYFLENIENAIEKAIEKNKLGQAQNYEKGLLVVERPKNIDFGDYAINVSPLARSAKIAPPLIAQNIISELDDKDNQYTVIGGFINFKCGNKILSNVIGEIFDKKTLYGKPERITPEKIILEYVSANPTGPFHIGHGRWAAMGSVLANLLKFYGHDVYQEFYINDAGSQIQKLGKSLLIRIKQELGEKADFPTDEIERKNYYTGEYLIPTAKKFLSENSPTEDIKILSDYAKKEMERQQKELLENFNVHFDRFYSELDLHNSGKVEECVNKLKASGKIYEKDGAVWFKSSDYGDDQDRVIKKADGANTYLTADIAYHIDKLQRGFDRMINIWGADHHGYVARVKASIEALGYNPDKLEVLLGQLVNLVINGEEVRMGKRKNMVTLDDLIEEVGVDATRFWMAMRNIDMTLDFDIELAKTKSDENPVFYVQYAHARACSVMRNLISERINSQTGEKILPPMSENELNAFLNNFTAKDVEPTIDSAKQIILKLEEYKNVIKSAAETRQVYVICRYVQELAGEFHSFYNANRIISEDETLMKSRIAIVWAVKTVLYTAMTNILGINAPERM